MHHMTGRRALALWKSFSSERARGEAGLQVAINPDFQWLWAEYQRMEAAVDDGRCAACEETKERSSVGLILCWSCYNDQGGDLPT